MNPSRIWIEQSEAARGIETEFGTQKALAYLIAGGLSNDSPETNFWFVGSLFGGADPD